MGSVCEDGRCVVQGDASTRDVTDTSDDPAVDPGVDSDEANACGGDAPLRIDGISVELGDSCGPCEDGFVVCSGPDNVRCAGAGERNPCGGCAPLPVALGDDCGPCGDGTWICADDAAEPVCSGASETNACGGCADLEETPLSPCEEDGSWQCTGPDELRCITADDNACGGDGALDLPHVVGEPCGACGLGTFACDPDDLTRATIICDDAGAGRNACGGCGVLSAAPGTSDERCPTGWTCAGADQVVCTCDRPNACGGCTALEDEPGDPCDFAGDEDGTTYCVGPNHITCGPSGFATCGGTTEPANPVGVACGGEETCTAGVFACVGFGRAACIGAVPGNACGGCGALAHAPGEPCAAERVWTCIGETLRCEDPDDFNACGGPSDLEHEVGSACGTCDSGTWRCDGIDALTCAGVRVMMRSTRVVDAPS